MLRKTSEPLALSEASLLALRPALNAPVLNVEFLPVGPARAAAVVFAEEWGGIGLALGIRAVESGQIVVFRNQEPLDEAVDIANVLEPALAAAERIGFLFDDDMLSGDSAATGPGGQIREDAMALWARLMGEIETPEPRRPKRAGHAPDPGEAEIELELEETEADAPPPELVLEDVAEFDDPDDLDLESIDLELPVAPAEPAAVPVARVASGKPARTKPKAESAKKPGGLLSKFRGAPARAARKAEPVAPPQPSADPNADSSPALGRISLKRVQRDRRGREHVPFLARLLSSF